MTAERSSAEHPTEPGSAERAGETPAGLLPPSAAAEAAERDRAFWAGEFTLRSDDTPDRQPAPALDPLGPSGTTVRGRDLAELLAPAYRRFTGRG
ncbi:hypothetical protein [Kitasatospora sp. NPDC051914]|uniref:hypothetical protein n=1 Tax=Kitasatospora sp. NPDC051914 TaxID=3154945 RepID=UPI00344915B2